MKKVFFALMISFLCFGLQAQEKGKIRVGGNFGVCFPPSGIGMSIDILDVRYNIFDNINAGIKFGGAFMVRDIYEVSATRLGATMHLNSNTMLVGDYYFHKGNSLFAPFVGGGIGSFNTFNLYAEFNKNENVQYNYNQLPKVPKVWGGSIRAGFEFSRLRMALEYYMIPKTSIFDAENIMQSIGQSSNSYLTLNLGIILGGGKWQK